MPKGYEAEIHGGTSDVEGNCSICSAKERYCPGHDGETRYHRERGGAQIAPLRLGSVGGPDVSDSTRYGYFSGYPIARWTPDGSRMILESDFMFFEAATFHHWRAPQGTILDGASIPRAFWTLVGSPFRGKYRYASIVHDHHCVERSMPWGSVHMMFFRACLAGGTSKTHAKLLYYAVYHFGPRWPGKGRSGVFPKGRIADQLGGPQVESIERWIVENDPDLVTIQESDPPAIGIPDLLDRRK